jgi:diguanylate cyclase (GGDEF)-like protein
MEMRDLNLKLERYTYIDGLTKITNRRMLDNSLKNEWDPALRTQSSLAFIMIDIDFFKSYNDHYGHVKGDECLRRIAKILNRIANRSSDVVARFGGEEFAILVPHANILQATTLAEKCRIAIEEANIPRDFEDAPCRPWVTVSIGVSCAYPTKHNSAKKLVKEADSQLYRAKHNGRNCVASTQA